MPKLITEQELDHLVNLIAAQPEGLGVEALLQALAGTVQRRSLQRRLSGLVKLGRLQCLGEARAAHYVCPPHGVVDGPFVAFRPAFLDGYLAGGYLPIGLRRQLQIMGQMGAEVEAEDVRRDASEERAPPAWVERLCTDLAAATACLDDGPDRAIDPQTLWTNHWDVLNCVMGDLMGNLNAEPETALPQTLLAVHALLCDGVLDDASAAGRLRRKAIQVPGTAYKPLGHAARLESVFAKLSQTAQEIADPFEQAFFLLVQLSYVQPFADLNNATARLAVNIPLLRNRLCPISFVDVPTSVYLAAMEQVYTLNRVDLLRALFTGAYARSCQRYAPAGTQPVSPQAFRQAYRLALTQAIKARMQPDAAPSALAANGYTPDSVAPADRARFQALVQAELASLHAGNAVRFGIEPALLEAWVAAKSALIDR
jgi:fido (protein-threonine AMPylation protein)